MELLLLPLPIFKIWMNNNVANIGFHMINFVYLETNTIRGINGTQISRLPLINR
jgi:hypothetical protein